MRRIKKITKQIILFSEERKIQLFAPKLDRYIETKMKKYMTLLCAEQAKNQKGPGTFPRPDRVTYLRLTFLHFDF